MDSFPIRARFSARAQSALIVPAMSILLAGCAAAGSAGATPSAGPTTASTSAVLLGAPAISQVGGATGSGTSSAASSNVAVAYPYPVFGGSAGLAPDHELVVSGTGTATMKTDESDRLAAQRTALAAALSDARNQAEAAAGDAGVSLGGVVSLSVSVNGGYFGIMPMGPAGAPETVPSSDGTTIAPPVLPGSAPSTPTTERIQVTVTVAYSIR